MDINIAIYNFEQQLDQLLIKNQLPIGIVKYILNKYSVQTNELYNQYIQAQIQQQDNETSNQPIAKESQFEIPFTADVPVESTIQMNKIETPQEDGQE